MTKKLEGAGLRGQVAGETSLSTVGQIEGLAYRGHKIETLAEKATFEEVAYLLLYDKLPNQSELNEYKALLKTEDVNLEFSEDGIDMLAKISAEVNSSVENIGARRLHTIIEKVLDDISFNATDKAGETITVDQKYVKDNLGNLVKDTDLSKFIL